MKYGELDDHYAGLMSVKGLKGAKFAHAATKNKKLIEAEIEVMREVVKISDEFLAFDKIRVELCEKYARKGDDGEAMMKESGGVRSFDILNQEEFDVKLKELREEHKEVLDARESQMEDLNNLFESVIEPAISFVEISIDSVPDQISVEQMEGITFMIKD